MEVSFVSHACVAIQHEGELLLTDPWFQGRIFNDSWSLLHPPDLSRIDFHRLRHIVISHEHPDHLSFATLRDIRERTSGGVTVYYRMQENKNVREAVERLGYEVVELPARREVSIAPGLSITSYPTRQDAAQVIRAGDRVILNQNDCRLLPEEVAAIRKTCPRIDLWLFQFSLAGYYANADDHEGLSRARRSHLRLIAEYHEAFRPGIFVPYASFVRFCKEANAYMNDWVVDLDTVMEAFPGLPIQILAPGDAVLWSGWSARNDRNLALWREIFAGEQKIEPQPPVDEAEILHAANRLVEEGTARELPPFRPSETHLQIQESGHALSIDFLRGRAAMLGRPDRRRLAGILPGDELLYFLKFPWGADTLGITACFRVTDALRWRRLMRFRNSLYLGTVREAYREKGVLWLLGRLARGAWNRARSTLGEQDR